jgi:hypothetical protein
VGCPRSQYRSAQPPAVQSAFPSLDGQGRTRFCSIWQAPWHGIAACSCSGIRRLPRIRRVASSSSDPRFVHRTTSIRSPYFKPLPVPKTLTTDIERSKRPESKGWFGLLKNRSSGLSSLAAHSRSSTLPPRFIFVRWQPQRLLASMGQPPSVGHTAMQQCLHIPRRL